MIFYLLLGSCLLLGLALAVAAWRRPDPRRRLPRALATVVAIGALWLMAYPPHTTRLVRQAEAILLTDQYQPDTLRALLRRLGPGTRIWRYQPDFVATGSAPSDTPAVARLAALAEQQPAVQRLHVLGTGLPAAVLPAPATMQLMVHAPPARTGFRTAHWNRSLALGQPLLIEGFFESASRAPVWVRLQAAGTVQDSVRLPAGQGAFRLRYTPKTAGRLVAMLSAGPTGRLVAREPVPAEVQPPRPLRVLVLAATASFELKFLKNQLAAQQHAVAWRAGISRGLTQTEFSNHSPTDLSRLSPTLLARYDVVVADAAALTSLSSSEAQALRAAQQQTGLGMVVLTDAGPTARNAFLPSTIRLVAQAGATAERPQRLAQLPAAAVVPATLQLAGPARALISVAESARPVVAAQRLRLGTVVVSTLPETYPWLLQNKAALYNSYWSRLLTAAARPTPPASHWAALEPWPKPGLPLGLQLSAATVATRPPVAADAAGQPLARLALQQDSRLPEWSTATYWPTQAGWQQFERPGQASQWLYIFDKHDWLGPQQHGWAQLARTGSRLPPHIGATPAPQTATDAWPIGWFMALFVLAAGFLWLEEKL
ncbi:hypothetical protein [Hymenobacter psychrotolerans]|uniref:Uncharacterized protein n=1 Tax=Hymenobacter psychrotolerans DSM 18569 TaxID=1121959 RepID=A0A1M6PKC3_9BACT|nr:hypothetical protein [Hymenobacter psychrotolerans]SHK08381.1 hypothetical protein SAMN02746009_00265 [Hymenobacter psychrotolerans DSM 18569]